MKFARLGGHILNLDKVLNMEYDKTNYIATVTYKYLYVLRKKELITDVLEADFERVYRMWDEHSKTIILYVN